MGYKDDLIAAGKDGFRIIEERMEKKKGRCFAAKKAFAPPQKAAAEARKTSMYQYQPQQTHVYQVKPLSENETRLNKYEVVGFRGVSIMDYSHRNYGSVFY